MSMLFPPSSTKGYHRFAKNHLTDKTTLRAKIKSLFPLFLTADMRYIVLRRENSDRNKTTLDLNVKFEFMFFSNPSGKILITENKTLINGIGILAKTTTTPAYKQTLLREAQTISTITRNPEMKDKVPNIIKHINTPERCFILEEYIEGKTLREIFRTTTICMNTKTIIGYIDRLEDWFMTYRSTFSGKLLSINELYETPFNSFQEIYSNDQSLLLVADNIKNKLAKISKNHPGLIPITAHNDLWPGNFLETTKGLIAIDWERAAHGRCEIFDFFWMIISTAMEYLIGMGFEENYSLCYRKVIQAEDPVCAYAYMKLIDYIQKIGFSTDDLPVFMQLFLLEWSVQGYNALGRRTAMDEIAIYEFVHFHNK